MTTTNADYTDARSIRSNLPRTAETPTGRMTELTLVVPVRDRHDLCSNRGSNDGDDVAAVVDERARRVLEQPPGRDRHSSCRVRAASRRVNHSATHSRPGAGRCRCNNLAQPHRRNRRISCRISRRIGHCHPGCRRHGRGQHIPREHSGIGRWPCSSSDRRVGGDDQRRTECRRRRDTEFGRNADARSGGNRCGGRRNNPSRRVVSHHSVGRRHDAGNR